MKRILIALAAILAVLPSGSAKVKAPSQIKVISYNIRTGKANDGPNSWIYRAPASPMMILDRKPDVFGLQEALHEQAQFMLQCLPGYKYVGKGRDDGKKAGEVMAIFYNKKTVSLLKWGTWWLSETPGKPSKGWDAACFRTATWAVMKEKESGKKFIYVNTHLDHKGPVAREKGLEVILEGIAALNKKDLPVIVTGDFNMMEDAAPMAAIASKMKNARKTAAVTDEEATFTGWGKVSRIIDYIYYDGFSSCVRYETVKKPYLERTFISDHFPIEAVLVF
ncbi:MAG: endonuclease/exonuclease/phosphatase family protein [Bacteroidales bacterium]|nr:endonuclease/exonuclease/phosphatase family protein [Bacteroidales bacterium]